LRQTFKQNPILFKGFSTFHLCFCKPYKFADKNLTKKVFVSFLTKTFFVKFLSAKRCYNIETKLHKIIILWSFVKKRRSIFMAVTKKPDLSDPVLKAKLAKGMGHNYYGEPAWPNDLLYIFPVVILGTFASIIGLAVLDPAVIGEPANPFATPLEILPEWYFYPVFQILRTVPNKLLGVLAMAAVPAGLIVVPFIENINKFQNPFRRPVATAVFLIGTVASIWLGIGATLPIEISLTLGLF